MPWVLRMTLLLLGVLIFIYAYIGVRLNSSVKQLTTTESKVVSIVILVLFFYLASYPFVVVISYFVGLQGFVSAVRFGNRLVDFLFAYPFWFGFVFAIQTIFVLLPLDIVKIIFSGLNVLGLNFAKFRMVYPWVVIFVVIISAIYTGVKIFADTNAIKVRKVEFNSSGVKIPLRIVHISDIQADSRTSEAKIRKYIENVNELSPDIVFFTGDLVTWGTDYVDVGARMLGMIKSRYGVFACLGDHDYWAGGSYVVNSLRRYGVNIFDDESIKLDIGGFKLGLTFITNLYSRRPGVELLNTLYGKVRDTDFKIFIVHQPSVYLVEFAQSRGYDIFLAGHTHGGQVVPSFFGKKIIASRVETKYVAGEYRVGLMLVNINAGLGFTLAPVRFNAPAEITLIEIK